MVISLISAPLVILSLIRLPKKDYSTCFLNDLNVAANILETKLDEIGGMEYRGNNAQLLSYFQ